MVGGVGNVGNASEDVRSKSMGYDKRMAYRQAAPRASTEFGERGGYFFLPGQQVVWALGTS